IALAMSAANKANIEERDQAIQNWMTYAQHLELQVAIYQAEIAGLLAYLGAMKKFHPDSPMMADSGARYEKYLPWKGDPKSKGRLIYEAAFDAKARELGIDDPTQYRED